jgi:hypothetical protein
MKKIFLILALLGCTPAFAALSANDIWQLDHQMGAVAFKLKLGTQLHAIELVTNGVLNNGAIFVGNSSSVATGVVPSGDVTISNAGVTAIGSAKIVKGMLATDILPSHVAKFAGSSASETDADGSIVVTATGAAATDVASVVLRASTNDVYVKKAVLTTDTLTVTLSGSGGVGTIVDYSIMRAVP